MESANSREAIETLGAGEGNRTLVFSLEGCCSTIELHPLMGRSRITPGKPPQPPCAGSDPKAPLFPSRIPALNRRRFDAYTDVSIHNERR
jgi:hypothetical protein